MEFITRYKESFEKLNESNDVFIELFKNGTMSIELFRPDKIDTQQPHEQDEVYVIASGEGEFILEGQKTNFEQGDVIFVPARKEHRFVNFSEDFTTWVFFYGPKK